MSLPEYVRSLCCEASVVGILWLGRHEWWMLSYHYKEDNGSCKKINRLSLVGLSQMYFWCHITRSSELGLQIPGLSVSTIYWACEAKVSNFQRELFVQKDVFRLEISMSVSLFVTFAESVHELLEIITSKRLLESSTDGNVVEELTTSCKFQNDIHHILAFSIIFLIFTVSYFNLFDYVHVLQLFHGLALRIEQLF